MTKPEPAKGVSDVVGTRLRDLRKLKRLSVEDLAARCAEVGSPELTANAIYAIENGRKKDGVRTRHVTVDELLALASALEVTPLGLLMPTGPEEQLLVSGREVDGEQVFEWLGGSLSSPFGDTPVAVGQYPAGLPEWLLERLRKLDAELDAERNEERSKFDDLEARAQAQLDELEQKSREMAEKTVKAETMLGQYVETLRQRQVELSLIERKRLELDAALQLTSPLDSDEFKQRVVDIAREAINTVIQERRGAGEE